MDVMLKDAAKAARLQKKIHAHLFRHSRATHLAKFLTEQELKIYFGWTGGSEMPAIYVHLSDEDVGNKVLKSFGIESNGHIDPITSPKFCPQCNTSNSSLQQFCKSCGSTLNKTEAMRYEKLQNVLIKYLSATGDKALFSKLMKEEGLE